MKRETTMLALEYIKDRILSFQLLPGVKISDEEVAKTLGISRTPVREALNRLAEQGLVEARPNRGVIVRTFRKKEVEDLYVLRENLECLAVRLAIDAMDKRDVKPLRDLLNTYPSLMKLQDLSKYNDADEQFHDLIALYSRNAALHDTLRNLQDKIRIVRRYDHIRTSSVQETFEEHSRILDHMVKREMGKAVLGMSSHILNSMKAVVRTLPG
jgi:DNA-binding GntR family transcriptional regulator